MNRVKLIICVFFSIVLCAGCQGDVKQENQKNIQDESQNDLNENQRKDDEGKTDSMEEKELVVYYISDEEEKILQKTVEVSQLDAATVWELLIDEEVVPEESSVLHFEREKNVLKLDVDVIFGDYLRKMGTTGEQYVITCIANTFLNAFECEKFLITENEETLCSGHMEYDSYIEKSE